MEQIDCVITDANLTEDDHSGNDGQQIVGEIRATHPDMPIIGFTGSDTFPGTDFYWNKENFNALVTALQFIKELPRR